MPDPIIACFQEEFERFFDLSLTQIEVCPESLWQGVSGGFPFWQHHVHTFSCVEHMYVPPRSEDFAPLAFHPRQVVMLSKDPGPAVSKRDVLAYAAMTKALALEFMSGLDAGRLALRHDRMSAILGKERTVQHALIGMVRHANYHLGCCDAVLREHGLAGVY